MKILVGYDGSELGGRALFVSTEVTSEESILGAVEQARELLDSAPSEHDRARHFALP